MSGRHFANPREAVPDILAFARPDRRSALRRCATTGPWRGRTSGQVEWFPDGQVLGAEPVSPVRYYARLVGTSKPDSR
ncbi:hypothetical protein [Streptomyces afghaniensis]|uniref:hypothetical protein n=1 Tax=Streptomyces afghaniensis TaxID=66865 RepID=UPI00278B1738|nr:hypothetical protein [Streptomyces afghaniensis]MDQ1018603.1 hypothetical protein [Streptomyces afghaniensis]